MRNYLSFNTNLGKVYVSADEKYVKGVWFESQKYFPKSEVLGLQDENNPILLQAKNEILQYLCGKRKQFHVATKLDGTQFQVLIWNILQTIPYGKTVTYAEIAKIAAKIMGRSAMSAQAVGNAVGRNPISIIIPCHRVIGTDGSLTGYAGGVARKSALLALEAQGIVPENTVLNLKILV